jgi:hypothetical protein
VTDALLPEDRERFARGLKQRTKAAPKEKRLWVRCEARIGRANSMRLEESGASSRRRHRFLLDNAN